jgi:hypothetical protein
MMKRKIRFFTLIEVLIASALTLIILAVLIGAYFQAQNAVLEGERRRMELWPKRTFAMRMEALFLHISEAEPEKQIFSSTTAQGGFYAPGSQTLLFAFDNGVANELSFTGEVLGRLFVDSRDRLTLLIWPARSKWKEDLPDPRREVLLTGVKKLTFQFLALPENGAPQWKEQWNKEDKEIPGMVKMNLTYSDNKEESFIFLIPQIVGVVKQ